MKRVVQRCRQCGWVHETSAEQIPRYGARIRCSACGSLLPLLIRPDGSVGNVGDETGGDPIHGGETQAGQEVEAAYLSRPAEGEAQEIVRLWLKEVARGEQRPLTEELLFQEYGAEFERLLDLWQASYPGPEAARIFREELLAALGNGCG